MERLTQGPILAPCFPTVTSAFYHHAATSPNAIAIHDTSSSRRHITYGQLANSSQALASRLQELGVQPNDRVPLVVKRSAEMIVGILGILSCGAQYVPLDGGVISDSTLHHVVRQSGGSPVVCLPSTESRVRQLCPKATTVPAAINTTRPEATPASEVPVQHIIDLATPDSGCYVIYTSGTTGYPKGVDVTHGNVVNLVCTSPGDLGVQPGTCVGSVLNISFDMAAWEIFCCLCNGGTLILRASCWEDALSQIDVLISTPTILSKYHHEQFPRIKVVATAGEPSSQNLADCWASRGIYWNCCGPTETTIVNTMSKHVVGQPLTIGRPTPNNTVYVLDDEGRPVKPGEIGTMWAGGRGVSRGYVGLELKTKETFISDPFAGDGSFMYKTGDLGEWVADGNIRIHGRVDDQIKIKGFRVELDGISASLASAPGILSATTILVNDEVHAFVCCTDETVNAKSLHDHMKALQPYYAIPSEVHFIANVPLTSNGKVNKAKLREIAAPRIQHTTTVQHLHKSSPSCDSKATTFVEVTPLSSAASLKYDPNVDVEKLGEIRDLTADLPDKSWAQPYRGLRHRIFIVYRVLFSLMSLLNLAILLATLLTRSIGLDLLATLTAMNLLIAILVRQDAVVNLLYTIACSAPKAAPLWLRARLAKVYHLGGVHAGAGICATLWMLANTVCSTVSLAQGNREGGSIATLLVSWLLCALLCIMVAGAWPAFRKRHHNTFEKMHRFFGWTSLVLFWIRTCLSVHDAHTEDFGNAIVRTPGFWLLIIATLSVASSWCFLRKVPVKSERLSDHAIRLDFDYTVPVNGSFTRLSRRPLLEWHSFATIPVPTSEGNFKTTGPGYSLVVSNAGDWTKNTILGAPQEIWVRGIPTCGVMRIATLFNRIVVIATGSGIGPLLGHISAPSCPTQLIWSTSNPEKTFGKPMLDTIRRSIPDAVIHDTKLLGRPDLVKMGYNLVREFQAEAVVVIANEKITKKLVYGLETRGISAYGAIWDS